MTDKSSPYVAELHDIGKLVDTESLRKAGLRVSGHTYHRFDFTQLGIAPPSSPSWWGQWHHNDLKRKDYAQISSLDKANNLPPDLSDDGKAAVMLTVMADGFACAVARTEMEKRQRIGREEGIRLLWWPDYYAEQQQQGKHWAAFRTPDELKQMFAFIDQCPTPETFFQKYEEQLRLTPDDKSVPLNFVPLRTHLDLVGKIFRVLRFWSRLVYRDGKPWLEYDDKEIRDIHRAAGSWSREEEKKGEWVFRLVQCHVRFPQSLARLQDLNVLRLRREKIEEIACRQKSDGDVERQPYAVCNGSA